MRAAYDSDISREKFKEIVPLLQSVRSIFRVFSCSGMSLDTLPELVENSQLEHPFC